jgi:hypothetical protein
MADAQKTIILEIQANVEKVKALNLELMKNREILGELKKDLKKSEEVLASEGKTRDGVNNSIVDQNLKIKGLNSELRENNKVQELNNRILTSKKGSYDQLSAKLSKARMEYKKLSEEERENVDIGGKLKKTINGLDTELKRLDAGTGTYTRNVGNYTGALKNMLGVFGVGMGIGAVVSQLKQMFDIFTKFEQSISKLTAIAGANTSEIRKMEQQARELGKTTRYTASEVVDAQTELSKLGFTVKEITDITPGVLNLATATGEAIGRAATVAGETMRGFGLASTEATRVMDIMAKSFNTTALDIEKYSTGMSNAQVAAKVYGLSLEKTTAMLGILVNTGVDASKAGTDLRSILTDLAVKGITLEQAFEAVNKSSNKVATAYKLVGERAYSSLITLAEQGNTLEQLTQQYSNANGEIGKMAELMGDNTIRKITRMKSAWEGFILSIENGNGFISKAIGTIVDFTSASIANYTALLEATSVSDFFNRINANILSTFRPDKVKEFKEQQAILEADRLEQVKKYSDMELSFLQKKWDHRISGLQKTRKVENGILELLNQDIVKLEQKLEKEKDEVTRTAIEGKIAAYKSYRDKIKGLQDVYGKKELEDELLVEKQKTENLKKEREARELEEKMREQRKEEFKRTAEKRRIVVVEDAAKAEADRQEQYYREQNKARNAIFAGIEAEEEMKKEEVAKKKEEEENLEREKWAAKEQYDLLSLSDKLNKEAQVIDEYRKQGVLSEEQAAEAIKKINYDMAESNLSTLASSFEQGSALNKAFALGEIAIDTGKAIAKLTSASEGNPANSVTFGGAGMIQFATGLIRIFANIAQAKKIITGTGFGQVPKKGRGGDVLGNSHSNGGVLIEAEGGEVVINKRSSRMFRNQLSAINQAGGGVPLMERGGAVNFMASDISMRRNSQPERVIFQPVLIKETLDQIDSRQQKELKIETN